MPKMKNKQLTITQNLNVNNNKIINVSLPTDNNDVINKIYHDSHNIITSGGTINGSITATNLSGNNTGDQYGDGVSILGTGTLLDPFVSVVGTPGLVPSYTTIQRLALTPLNGQQVLDTDFGYMFFYVGGSWEIL